MVVLRLRKVKVDVLTLKRVCVQVGRIICWVVIIMQYNWCG